MEDTKHPILDDNKSIPIMEDTKHLNLDGNNKSIPILDDKKHLILEDNKYIPIWIETSKFGWFLHKFLII